MDRSNAASVDAIEENLARRAAALQADADDDAVGGLKGLIALLTKSEKSVERAVVEALEALSPEMADEVRANLFVFEDIITLDDRAVQQILRQVDTRELAVALKGAADDVAHKVKSNMSSRAAENLVEEIEMLPPTRAADIKEARAAIVRVIRMLEDQGDIQINRGVDDFV
jgi:flagellar motor switch protein FliG